MNRWVVVGVVLTIASNASAQGIQPMTPQMWERARQDGMRGEVPANVPMLVRIDAAKASGDVGLIASVEGRLRRDPFRFRVLSPYVQAADAARDPGTAARMAHGVVSPTTMGVYIQVTPSESPDAPLGDATGVVIQRGGRVFYPTKTLPNDKSVNRAGHVLHGADFAFPVEAFVPTQPVSIMITGTNGTSMMWEMSVADLRALK